MKQFGTKVWSDLVGVISATFCLVHCLVMPLVLSVQLFHDNHLLHYIFVGISLLGVLATIRHSKIAWVNLALVLSFAALLVGSIFETQLFLVFRAGVVGLVFTHLINIYLVHAGKNKKALA